VAQGVPRAIATLLLALGVVHCSLLAPSDRELMGGNKGSSDAGDAGRMSDGSGSGGMTSDAMDDAEQGQDAGPCLQTGDCCGPGQCCAGLVCDTANSGVCLPCMQAGGSCFPGDNMCCSGTCSGHTCK
jgi:hypothetical protein